MTIYPAIDIKDGKCVRLQQGRFNQVSVYGEDPAEVALRWQSMGAEYLHVVDLDGALKGGAVSAAAIQAICRQVDMPVQTGGGVRSLADIENRLSWGVNRVILGTAAVTQPELVARAVEKYGDKIAVGIDAKNGYVATHGWEQVSGKDAVGFAHEMESLGVSTIIYTDIATDGMLSGPNISAMQDMAQAINLNIIASGGVGSLDDILALRPTGVHGVIVGKALYTGRVDLAQAIARAK